MQKSLEHIRVNLGGVTCRACEYKIEKALKELDGIDSVKVSFESSTADIIYKSDKINLNTIFKTIEETGYEVIYDSESRDHDSSNTTTLLVLIIITGLYIIVKNTVGFNFLPKSPRAWDTGCFLQPASLRQYTALQCAGVLACPNVQDAVIWRTIYQAN
ncbi:MAG TPA: heavy-metal-associated domain-containing protein [Tissierellia bacterium]|nr:heavy-metal-associated domain-containing protein [Tissierellia bacterium]